MERKKETDMVEEVKGDGSWMTMEEMRR